VWRAARATAGAIRHLLWVTKVTTCPQGAREAGPFAYTAAMTPSPPTTLPRRSMWGAGALDPLSIAAYITWLAVLLQIVGWEGLSLGEPREWAGVLAMLAFLALFVLRAWGESVGRCDAAAAGRLAVLQGCAALAVSWLLQSGTAAILLIIVAAQVFALYPLRLALAWQAAFNIGLAVIWSQALPWPRILFVLVPAIGFQAFAALTARYVTLAQRARDEVVQINAQLLATRALLDETARSEERLKLSRELHDVAGHKLTALSLNLARLGRDPALNGRDEVSVSAQLAHELLDDIRAVVGELRKHDGIDLRAALEALTRQIPGPRFRIELEPDARIDAVQLAETLLRCAQEGITNALRHGRPSEITIWCGRRGGAIELHVRDNGAAHPRIRFGNGLTGMRERLEALGGRLQVGPAPGRGVELIASVPAGSGR
jgi:signal transduction histidine kinase